MPWDAKEKAAFKELREAKCGRDRKSEPVSVLRDSFDETGRS